MVVLPLTDWCFARFFGIAQTSASGITKDYKYKPKIKLITEAENHRKTLVMRRLLKYKQI